MEPMTLIESMLTNFPNFAGLALLAGVLFWMIQQCMQRQKEAIEDAKERERQDAETLKWLMEALIECVKSDKQ